MKISANSTNAEDSVTYDITGYKDCIQNAFTAAYLILATTTDTPVQQSFPKPSEWEPQTTPIELKCIHEGSLEWSKIVNRMRETIPNVEVVSINSE